MAIRREVILRDRECAKSSHLPALADHGAELFNMGGVDELGDLSGLVCVKDVPGLLQS